MARHGQQPDGETRQRGPGEEGADARRDVDRKVLNTMAKRGHLENSLNPNCEPMDERARKFSVTKVPLGSFAGYDRRHETRPQCLWFLPPKCLFEVYGSQLS